MEVEWGGRGRHAGRAGPGPVAPGRDPHARPLRTPPVPCCSRPCPHPTPPPGRQAGEAESGDRIPLKTGDPRAAAAAAAKANELRHFDL